MAHTILIIDDTPEHLDILRRLLRGVGYRVTEAPPGFEAVHQAQRERPDLIVVALSLPGQPSWETARMLGTHSSLARTPILGTTVYSELLPLSGVRAIGCVGYIQKPFDMDDLLYRIDSLLSGLPAFPAA